MDKKVYKTPDELITILRDERKLTVSQPLRAKRLLLENNYYSITANKDLFYEKGVRQYKKGVEFEQLYAIYYFDKLFKTTILKHLLMIEQKIKTAISDHISKRYGYKDRDYLKLQNYDQSSQYLNDTINKIKGQMADYGSKNRCVHHYQVTYGYVPFWVLSKCLTMGVIRDYFQILKPSDQDVIAKQILEKEIKTHSVKKLKVMIALITDIRNMCAHDELLIGYKHGRLYLSPLEEHKLLKLKNPNNPKEGRNDLLALLITIKYLVNKTTYHMFMEQITSLINRYYSKIKNVVTLKEFLNYIGLTENYQLLDN